MEQQSKTLSVQRGLFLLRYAEAEDEASPPKVQVLVDRTVEGRCALIVDPDHTDTVLWQPGTALVVKADAASEVEIRVIATKKGGSTAATLRLEPLTQGGAKTGQGVGKVGSSKQVDLSSLRLMGHVAQIGDVSQNGQGWIAGPDAPARVEGIALEWPSKPDNVEIKYAIRLPGEQPPSGELVRLGEYAGTRRRALPLVGLVLQMSGYGAAEYRFLAEAIFLGSPMVRASGQRIDLAGPTGREPLVGLRVAIEPTAAEAAGASGSERQSSTASGRVRVFRSSTNVNR